MFEDLCRDAIRSCTFVVFQAPGGLAGFKELWRSVEMQDWWKVWKFIEDVKTNRVGEVEEGLKLLCPPSVL
uniref:Uncharacterized protein n=1 Tax=Anguilla anguilla TaxID=7936 RepID=A0A0E9U552_ANGAN